MLVLILILMSAYCFALLEVVHHVWSDMGKDNKKQSTEETVKPHPGEIFNWFFYALILVLTLWSLFQVVFSSPGYVPRGYQYRVENMSSHDRLIFTFLKHALHSTTRQQMEAMDHANQIVGTYSQVSASSYDPLSQHHGKNVGQKNTFNNGAPKFNHVSILPGNQQRDSVRSRVESNFVRQSRAAATSQWAGSNRDDGMVFLE